jgi:hypothetical protein
MKVRQEAMMEACPEKMEAMDLEENREEIESESEHHEDPKEEATVETVRAQEDQLRDTGTHGKEGPRTVLYRGPRKDRWSRRDDGRAWNVIMD